MAYRTPQFGSIHQGLLATVCRSVASVTARVGTTPPLPAPEAFLPHMVPPTHFVLEKALGGSQSWGTVWADGLETASE